MTKMQQLRIVHCPTHRQLSQGGQILHVPQASGFELCPQMEPRQVAQFGEVPYVRLRTGPHGTLADGQFANIGQSADLIKRLADYFGQDVEFLVGTEKSSVSEVEEAQLFYRNLKSLTKADRDHILENIEFLKKRSKK